MIIPIYNTMLRLYPNFTEENKSLHEIMLPAQGQELLNGRIRIQSQNSRPQDFNHYIIQPA